MPTDPIEVTKEVFQRFGRGDVPGIVELLDETIYIQFYGPPVIPYAAEYRGLKEARQFFETVLASVDIHQFEPEQYLADGEIVTVTGRLHLTARATGRDIRSEFAHIITVKKGKWVHFRDFMDTASAAAAFA